MRTSAATVDTPDCTRANAKVMKDSYAALYGRGASVILTGHDHHFEQFARHTPDGDVDTTKGVRAFVVGTGGKDLYQTPYDKRWPFPLSEVYNHVAYGVLRIDLYSERYRWQFVPVKDGATISLKVGEETLDNDTCNERPQD
jgi:hypothetical protein